MADANSCQSAKSTPTYILNVELHCHDRISPKRSQVFASSDHINMFVIEISILFFSYPPSISEFTFQNQYKVLFYTSYSLDI
jgi:hypothetical protein